MKSIQIYILIFILASALPGCKPDLFNLNRANEYEISGKIVSGLETVKITGKNEITLKPGAKCYLGCARVTQLHADITAKVLNGKGLRFYFRTVNHEFERQPRIRFDFTTEGCFVYENKQLAAHTDTVKVRGGAQARLQIFNDGPLYNITVDCDTVHYAYTELPATEYLIIESLESDAILSGINFAEVVEIKKTEWVLKKTLDEENR